MLHLTPFITAYILALTAVLGLVLGSFSNCAAWRMVNGESVSRGRSHCAVCGHALSAVELIPLLSWLIQGGKCKHCGEKISVRYPLTELFTALAFAAVVLKYDVTVTSAMYLALTLILLIIALADFDSGIIPDRMHVFAVAVFVIATIFGGGDVVHNLLYGAVGAAVLGTAILIIVLIMDKVLKKDTMGGGDIKLFYVLGLYFPFVQSLFLVVLACVLGIVFALVFPRITVGDDENPKAFPFGPAIAAAAFVCIFAAEPFARFYMGLLGF